MSITVNSTNGPNNKTTYGRYNKNHLLMHRRIRPSDEEGRARAYLGIGPSFKYET